MKRIKLSIVAILFFITISLVSAQPSDCAGWGGVKVDDEFVCCTCAGNDGFCPNNVIAGVCIFGDSDCGNCDIGPLGNPTLLIDTISWTSKVYDTSNVSNPKDHFFTYSNPNYPSWIRGESVLFNGTGTDNSPSDITRGMDKSSFILYINNTAHPIPSVQTSGNLGDKTIKAWYYVNTTPLIDGGVYDFQLYGMDLAGNHPFDSISPIVSTKICNDLDLDACEDACVGSGFGWNLGGSVPDAKKCCGNDMPHEPEYMILNAGTTDDFACCNDTCDCAVNDICFPSGTEITIDEVRYECKKCPVPPRPEPVKRLCNRPSDVGKVDVFGNCCSLKMNSTLISEVFPDNIDITHIEGRVSYFLKNKSEISNDDETFGGKVLSGCFDGLDTTCSYYDTINDKKPAICPYEGMYLDDKSIDFDDWQKYYEDWVYSDVPDYDVDVVRDRNCLDGLNNDESWDISIPGFCKDESYDFYNHPPNRNYWDRKCSNETDDNYPQYMFDLLDNDCDGYIDFGRVPNLIAGKQGDFERSSAYNPDSADWMNSIQDSELFEDNSKVKLYGTVETSNKAPLKDVIVIARLSQNDWYPALDSRNKSVTTNVQEVVPITYFSTRTNEDGKYEMYINKKTAYNLHVNFSNPEYEKNYIVPYKTIRSTETEMTFSNTDNEMKRDLIAYDAKLVSCDGCALAGTNRCYAGCMNNATTCPFPEKDWVNKEDFIFACSDLPVGTLAFYKNQGTDAKYVLCCNGSSLISLPSSVSPTTVLHSDVENAVRYTKAVTLYGVPVKMRVVLIEK